MPLIWITLPQTTKRGNSNMKQRIALMRKILKVLPVKDIHSITLDREFNGYEWLKWLDKEDVSYVLRLRKNTKIAGKSAKLHRSTRKSKQYKTTKVFGLELYFACKYINKGRADYLYVVSNQLPPPLRHWKSTSHVGQSKSSLGTLKRRGLISKIHTSGRSKRSTS